MKKKILVTLPVNSEHKKYLEECLEPGKAFYELCFTEGENPSEAQLKEAAVLLGIYSPAWAKEAVNAEWIQLASAGADAFTAPGILPEGAVLTNAVGAYGLSVSEHMLAMTFYMIRNFGVYSRNRAAGIWNSGGNVSSIEGSTIAVLGTGNIGGSYARKVKALGAYVIGVRRSVKEKSDWLDEQYTIDNLDKVLPRADITAMILPGGGETYHIMNEEKLRLMKKDSYLLNAGRGNSIDPEALKKLLKEGRFRGVALDVTEPEPLPAGDELWSFDNVFITPHVAGGLYLPETLNRIVKIMGENLERWCTGRHLKNRVQ